MILWTKENGKELEEEQVEALKASSLMSVVQSKFEEGAQVFYKAKNSNTQWEGTIHSVLRRCSH